MKPSHRHAAWPLIALGALGIPACKGCDEDRPYTPFGVTSSLPSATSLHAADTLIPVDAGAAPTVFRPALAAIAPETPTQWPLGERLLQAPPGLAFAQVLAADFDVDGSLDAVAWLVPTPTAERDAPTAPGSLWYFPGTEAPRTLSGFPGFVPNGPGCSTLATLRQTGRQTVVLEVAAKCEGNRLPRSPTRSLQVLAPARAEPQILGFRLADAAAGETINVGVDTTDRDSDGLDDIDLTVTVGKNGTDRPASGHWIWLDRTAGPSRDDTEPGASFARVGSIEQVRSTGKNTSLFALDAVDNARRLFATICAEGGSERLWTWDGASLNCGALGPTVDRLSHAEVQASLKQRDVLRAFSVLQRDGWYSAKMSTEKRGDVEKLLAAAVTAKAATVTTLALQLRPVDPTSPPSYAPLSFDEGGNLLVQTSSGRVRTIPYGSASPADIPATAFEQGPAAQQPWPLLPQGPKGDRWSMTLNACGRSEVSLLFGGGSQYGAEQVPTEVIAARPGSCKGRAFVDGLSPTPVAWTDGGLTALLGGRLVELGSLADARRSVPFGSPLSLDGRRLVVPTTLGLLVLHDEANELWTVSPPTGTAGLHHCVIANGATRAACVKGIRAAIVDPAP